MIDIDHDDRKGALVLRGRFDRFDQRVLKVVAQFEARHHVGRRDLVEKGVVYGDIAQVLLLGFGEAELTVDADALTQNDQAVDDALGAQRHDQARGELLDARNRVLTPQECADLIEGEGVEVAAEGIWSRRGMLRYPYTQTY